MSLTWDGASGAGRMAAAAIVAMAVAAATILGAWFFELVLGYAPCPLCLTQRIPYYVAIPVAAAVAIAANMRVSRRLLAGGLAVVAIAMLIGAGLGIYHAGVEWKWWAGPSGCAGAIDSFGRAGGLLETIESTPVIRCEEAAWRLFGLSLAGYNALISLVVAGIALWGAAAATGGRDTASR